MTQTTRRLTTTEHAILGLLAFGERSGYDLARRAERSIGYMWAPSRSQIYKVLPRLVGWGYATSRGVEQKGRPDKELYRITPEGRAVLQAWLEEVEDEPRGGSGVFLLKLFFAWAASAEAGLRQLEAYRRLLERHLTDFEALERELATEPDKPVHSHIALRHGITRARATLQWAEETRRTLEKAEKNRQRILALPDAR